MLWPWELPDATVLVLSTRDALVPSELVKKQLEYGLKGGRAHKIRVLEKDLHHGYDNRTCQLRYPAHKLKHNIISTSTAHLQCFDQVI